MSRKDIMHCNKAVAEAVKLCDVDVIAAYPITPATSIAEYLAEYVAQGEIDTEYIKVESEHSAMSACIGASATGARTFTATSSQGLALMSEVMYTASGMRLPIVMANANRALSAPINIWNDQQDSMMVRDSGWIQFYAENNQEALDYIIQAFRVAEKVLLPAMVNLDGFYLTHTVEPTEVPDKEEVKRFLPDYKPTCYLDPKDPMTLGFFADPSWFEEFRYEQENAMQEARKEIRKASEDYEKIMGRKYTPIEEYKSEDKDILLLTVGSVSGTAKEVVDALEKKYSVGVVKLREFRPFPFDDLKRIAKGCEVMGVIEKDVVVGLDQGAIATEVKNAMYNLKERPKVLSFIVGLGGRDTPPKDIETIIRECDKARSNGVVAESMWVGLK